MPTRDERWRPGTENVGLGRRGKDRGHGEETTLGETGKKGGMTADEESMRRGHHGRPSAPGGRIEGVTGGNGVREREEGEAR